MTIAILAVVALVAYICVRVLGKEQSDKDQDFIDAAKRGDFVEVQRVLENNEIILVDIEATDPELGRTALYWASRDGNVETVELLVKYGAKVDAKDNQGDHPLIAASYTGKFEIAELLARRYEIEGVSIDLQNNLGASALYIAAKQGHIDIMRMLVEQFEADVNQGLYNGWTMLDYALKRDKVEIVDYLRGVNAECNLRCGKLTE